MFGDFVALAFDQIVNFAAKSVVDVRRAAADARSWSAARSAAAAGTGPTHSQSLQKHFVGIPDLVLAELSPFHDVRRQLDALLEDDRPAILFEDKVLYTERAFPDEPGDGEFELQRRGDWAHLRLRDEPGTDRAILVMAGGVARRGMAAARTLRERGVAVDLLVPGRLHPFDAAPVIEVLAGAATIHVAEEGTACGTWGAEVARVLHEGAWEHLQGPVRTIASADQTIPAAPHLERRVVLGEDDLVDAVLAHRRPPSGSEPVLVPKLNNNDDRYLLLRWLVDDGARASAGEAVLEVETSKAVQEIESPVDGWLHHGVTAGSTCHPGDEIAQVSREQVAPRVPTPVPTPTPAPAPALTPSRPPTGRVEDIALSVGQQRVAEVVTTSHREVPTAFAAVRASAAPAHDAGVDLAALTLRAIGDLLSDHPLVFGRLSGSGTSYLPAEAAHVAVTIDVGTGLVMPVMRDVGSRRVEDLLDDLTDLRMKALRGRIAEDDLRDARIALSLALPGITLVQPIVPPGLAAIVSLAGDVEPTDDPGATVTLGIAHDHRIVNGAEAMAFLTDLATLLRDPASLTQEPP